MRQCRRMASPSKDTVDENPYFIIEMKCRNYLKKCLDGSLAAHTIASWLAVGASYTSIDIFQNRVLLLTEDFSHPPWHDCIVFNHFPIYNITSNNQSIPHLHSARHGDRFAPSQHPPMPTSWFMVVTVYSVRTIPERCILLGCQPSNVIAGYKNWSKNRYVRYDCRACVEISLW